MKKLRLLGAMCATAIGLTLSTYVHAQDDLVYVAVEPCRIVDTRNAGGAIPANNFRNFLVSGTIGQLAVQGGTTNCLDPKAGTGIKPLAISAYVLAVPPPGSGSGVLTAYPSNQLPPPVGSGSTVNFAAGQIIGNTTNITICDPNGFCPSNGEFAILARNTNQHVVIDVQGYFYPQNGGIDVNTLIVETQSDFNVGGVSYSELVTATCPTGSIMTGGGVVCSSDNFDPSTTNYGVVAAAIPTGNSYTGGCYADFEYYSESKFGPAVTAFAVCAYYAAALQATSEGVATFQATSAEAETSSQPQQGEPSEEALLLLESLRNKAAERERMIKER